MEHDEWIEQGQHRAHLGSHGQAERATRATLETLSEHLAGEEARALAAQLPLEMGERLRGQWSPRGERSSLEECLRRASLRVGIDLPVAIFQARAVIEVLGEAISKAERDDVFAQAIQRLSLLNASIVAPDEGATDRCQAVARAAGMSDEIVVLAKRRKHEGIVHVNISGNAGPQAVIVDDILDTGGTLVSCCEQLQQRSVRDITILVTHGLFTGLLWQKLWSLGVKRIYCTDTVPPAHERSLANICTLAVLPLLRQHLQARQ